MEPSGEPLTGQHHSPTPPISQAPSQANTGVTTQPTTTNQQQRSAANHSRSPCNNKNQRHQLSVAPDAPRLSGIVVSRQDKYGFIKSTENDQRYFFHLKDTDGVATQGATVSFVVARDLSTGKDVAFNVVTVAERANRDPVGGNKGEKAGGREKPVEGTFEGTVVAIPRGPATVKVDDGMIVLVDNDGVQQQAFFGAWRLAGKAAAIDTAVAPSLGDLVAFELVKNTATKVLKAVNVRIIDTRNAGAIESSGGDSRESVAIGGRHLGRVALLKKEFGFIRQVSRPGDLFFHFTQLQDIDPSEIKVGDDVEFAITRNNRDNKLSAHSVTRAPPGSVKFDVVSEKIYRGVILEKPLVGKQYQTSSGVIEYSPLENVLEDDNDDEVVEDIVLQSVSNEEKNTQELHSASNDGAGVDTSSSSGTKPTMKKENVKRLRIIFSANECAPGSKHSRWRPGDNVNFRIAINIAASNAAAAAAAEGKGSLGSATAAMAGKRAVEVTPLRVVGTVANVQYDRKFGFILFPISALLGPSKENVADERVGEEEENAEDVKDDSAAEIERKQKVEGTKESTEEIKAPKMKQKRVFFHFSELQGLQSSSPVRVGDEVSFVLHTNMKNGELNAARIKRIKEAPIVVQNVSVEASSNAENAAALGEPSLPVSNPNKINFTGNLQSGAHKTQKHPKMPDGTRGFSYSREKSLDAVKKEVERQHADAALNPNPFFAGLELRGLMGAFAKGLSMLPASARYAKEFVPGNSQVNSKVGSVDGGEEVDTGA